MFGGIIWDGGGGGDCSPQNTPRFRKRWINTTVAHSVKLLQYYHLLQLQLTSFDKRKGRGGGRAFNLANALIIDVPRRNSNIYQLKICIKTNLHSNSIFHYRIYSPGLQEISSPDVQFSTFKGPHALDPHSRPRAFCSRMAQHLHIRFCPLNIFSRPRT